MQIHWIATYLDPSFRDLSFVTDKSYRNTQLKSIKEGLLIMADEIGNERKDLNDSLVSKKVNLATLMCFERTCRSIINHHLKNPELKDLPIHLHNYVVHCQSLQN